MIQLTLGQSLLVISSAGAAWLMIRAGVSENRLVIRVRPRCASCGRRLTAKTCSCASSAL
jgi:transposase-like protein